MTPEEHAEWRAAYAEELAGPGDEGEVLARAAERTAHLWGVRIAPDGAVVLNPDRLSPDARVQFGLQPGDGYVTKVAVPDSGDGGVQRLHSHFLQPEREAEPEA